MPRLSEETYGTGDQTWLGSSHGIWNGRTEAPGDGAFTATDYPDGHVLSGTPVAVVDNRAVPFDAAGDDGSEVLAGFVFTDQKLPVEGGIPVLDHGRIKVDNLPVAFDPSGVTTSGTFVFLEGVS